MGSVSPSSAGTFERDVTQPFFGWHIDSTAHEKQEYPHGFARVILCVQRFPMMFLSFSLRN
jgi:hypothetical protein